MDIQNPNPKTNYDLLKLIGSGTYGKVYKAVRKSDDKSVAVKIIDISYMDRAGIENVLNEVRILSSISNPYIVEYYEAFIDNSETTFWMVMEYLGGGDLANAINLSSRDGIRINERQIWCYMIQLLQGIQELHKLKIIHRDIKPANIFLTDDYKRVKIGDMNVSKVLKEDLTKTQIGTPYYLAPEIWNKKAYDFRADVYSLGALIYELAALKHPHEANSAPELHLKIMTESIPRLPSLYSDELNYIVSKCLTKEQILRPTVEQLLNSRTIQTKINEMYLQSYIKTTTGQCYLLDTIVAPKKLSMLNNKLPKKGMIKSQSNNDYNNKKGTLDGVNINIENQKRVSEDFAKLKLYMGDNKSDRPAKDSNVRRSSKEPLSRKSSSDKLKPQSIKCVQTPEKNIALRNSISNRSSNGQLIQKQTEETKPVLILKKASDGIKRPPLPPSSAKPNPKTPPILQKFNSLKPSDDDLPYEKKLQIVRRSSNGSNVFTKKFVTQKVEHMEFEDNYAKVRCSDNFSSGKNQQDESVRYADYVKKTVNKATLKVI